MRRRCSGLPRLLRDLRSRDVSKRRGAAEQLADCDERAIYPLLKALRDENPGVQDGAMRSLIAIGGEVTAYMAVPLLREDSYLRNTALIILKEIGAPAVPLLYSLLRDKDDDVRKFGLDLLIDINCEVDGTKLIPLLKDSNQNVRASAAKAIGVVMQQEGIPYLAGALDDDEWVVFSVLEALSKIRDSAPVPAIIRLLDSPSITIRFAAIEALGNIGSPAASAPLLEFFLRADDMEKREAVKSLVKIGVAPSMCEIAAILGDMLRDGDWDERLVALRGLVDLGEEKAVRDIIDIGGSLDPSHPESEDRLHLINEALRAFGCCESLVACLDDPAIRFRGRVLAIGIVGELKCDQAISSLLRLIGLNLRDVRRASVKALGEMSDQDSRQVLEDAVRDHDSHVRKAAINALGRIGDRASADILLQLLRTEQYGDILEEVVRSLLVIDQDALFSHLGELDGLRRVLLAKHCNDQKMLIRLAGDEEIPVRVAAISSLGRNADGEALARLHEYARDRETAVRKAAVMAMGDLRCCYEEIQAALGDEDMWVRLFAVKALGRSENPDMVPPLALMLTDPEMPVILSAIDAIAQLGGREAFAALDSLGEHEDPAIREKALQALESL